MEHALRFHNKSDIMLSRIAQHYQERGGVCNSRRSRGVCAESPLPLFPRNDELFSL